MSPDTDPFAALRPRLFGIAYRMLGTRADAEDVLQDAWLRWSKADRSELQSTEAWLVTVVTRLSIDRLRAAKAEREAYVGWWLPEPLVEIDEHTPEAAAELAGGKAPAFSRILHGADRIANLFLANSMRLGDQLVYRMATINGEPGLLRYLNGKLESALSCATDGERIVGIYAMRNPDKLAGIPPLQ
jgi:hypothetical protein